MSNVFIHLVGDGVSVRGHYPPDRIIPLVELTLSELTDSSQDGLASAGPQNADERSGGTAKPVAERAESDSPNPPRSSPHQGEGGGAI